MAKNVRSLKILDKAAKRWCLLKIRMRKKRILREVYREKL